MVYKAFVLLYVESQVREITMNMNLLHLGLSLDHTNQGFYAKIKTSIFHHSLNSGLPRKPLIYMWNIDCAQMLRSYASGMLETLCVSNKPTAS